VLASQALIKGKEKLLQHDKSQSHLGRSEPIEEKILEPRIASESDIVVGSQSCDFGRGTRRGWFQRLNNGGVRAERTALNTYFLSSTRNQLCPRRKWYMDTPRRGISPFRRRAGSLSLSYSQILVKNPNCCRPCARARLHRGDRTRCHGFPIEKIPTGKGLSASSKALDFQPGRTQEICSKSSFHSRRGQLIRSWRPGRLQVYI